MLESHAWRALSLSGRRVIDRLEIELGHHGGNDNGQLPVTKDDFIEYGISGNQIAPAIREAEALGFIRVTEHGRAGNSEHRLPSKFFLTFAYARTSRAEPPTHDWRKIKTFKEAKAIAAAARADKNPSAVMSGRRSWALRKNRNRYQKPIPAPVSETNTGTSESPVLETNTTERGRKLILLSISWVGPVLPLLPLPGSAPQLIEPPVPILKGLEGLLERDLAQLGPVRLGARYLLFEYLGAASSHQFGILGGQVLITRTNPRISEQHGLLPRVLEA